jgi:hypothetical protein
MTDEARLFRRRVRMATLTDYKADSQAGATKILPELVFAYPLKLQADILAHYLPFSFLTRLQAGVESPVTQPKTAREQGIAARFNAYFGKRAFRIQLERGTRAAHAAIINNWLNNKVGDSQWINFRDAGAWADTPQGNLNRSSFNEFILFGNNIDAAAYYQTFNDGNGVPLDGSNGRVYTLRFEKDEIPANERFWSLTAYTPHAIELIPNDANKYAVASYTPGLVTASDESITIVMSVSKPDGVPPANWLPVRDGRFNVMLRDYGPLGSVADGTYVPPPVEISE